MVDLQMKPDGKQLEALVAFVEESLVPEGFEVKTNDRVYNDDGVQIAEFDIEVRGKVGSTEISWLIECRDRPSSGPAPGAWIEQLVGRRTRFGFNKVTAVSTTGFATGAAEFALVQGIEVREVGSLNPDEFSDWLYIRHITQFERLSNLEHAGFHIDESEGDEKKNALAKALIGKNGNDMFLSSSVTGELTSPALAFSAAIKSVAGAYENLDKNGDPQSIYLTGNYSDDDHYLIETELGPIKIKSIAFTGSISLRVTDIPLFATSEYRKVGTGEVISQIATFNPMSIHGMKFTTEMHKLEETGETHIILRKVDGGA